MIPVSSLRELVDDWQREITEFATKDDPYYNGVRQCLSDVLALLDASLSPPVEQTLQEAGLCCMSQHATASPPWTCDCRCHTEND